MADLPERIERIVLIGLMGAGKSTVGARLAQTLKWTFEDLDQHIERVTGRTVQQIFEDEGEKTFRRLEQQLTMELLSGRDRVLAPGGGWVVHTDASMIPPNTAVFWLQVSPEEAVHRLADGPPRPLLAGNALERARQLAEDRNAVYGRAGVPVDTANRTPDEVVEAILKLTGGRLSAHEPFESLEHGETH